MQSANLVCLTPTSWIDPTKVESVKLLNVDELWQSFDEDTCDRAYYAIRCTGILYLYKFTRGKYNDAFTNSQATINGGVR